jgi:hypothetical protein
MTEPTCLSLKLKTDKIAAKPDALWRLVWEYIKGPAPYFRSRKNTTNFFFSISGVSGDGGLGQGAGV